GTGPAGMVAGGPAGTGAGGSVEPVVDVRDAFCLYRLPEGAVAALRGLTLQVAPGERVVVHGPNGSGKTTLLRVLAGEQRLSAGRALVAGVDMSAAGSARLARWRADRLGWVDQHPARMLRPELTVLDNVALQQRMAGADRDAAGQRSLDLLDRLGVAQLAARRPAELSGGEAQRAAVAAALAHGPRLVLADEPSGELDARSAEQVYDALAAAVAGAGAALVLVSHDRRAARVADRVVRIRDGRLSETWRPGPSPSARAVAPEELLVVDDRGWLRLPEPLRLAAGAADAVSARVVEGAIVLHAPGLSGRTVPDPLDGPGQPAGPRAGSVRGGSTRAEGSRADGSRAESRGREGQGDEVAPAGGRAPVAVLRGIRKAYGERVVLAGVDLDVPVGRLLVVRGRSGTGKSTLLRLLTGLDRPDAGTVTVDGTDLAGLDRTGLAALRRRVSAVVGQDVHLAETATVLANLELARAVRGLAPELALTQRRLAGLGLSGLAHREVRLLSGGERQRVAVARALVAGPRLVVLDEPTSQLDEASAEQLAGVLVEAAVEGAAVVAASHDPVLVAAADLVVDLEPEPTGPAVAQTGTGSGNS
ncbi:MAG TPA: ATP-binding cassette domain-containing protein, partial [Kineosporiaceae bacterium]|nr:ATP-binding cassette domain-containing protein [Kineosporiaceae bacterium]